MSSVGSRAEFPNRFYSPTPEDDFENQELRPLKPRRPSSYEEMNGSGADDSYTTEGHLHQYEDPRLLAEQMRRMNSKIPPPVGHEIRPRKKANDLYERCRTDSDGSETSRKSSRCRGAMCFLVTLSLLLALAAVAMVVLLVFGQLVPKSCEKCLKNIHRSEGVPQTNSQPSSTPNLKHLEHMIKILQANLTQLHQIVRHRDEVIKRLMETDKSHTEQLNVLFRNQLSDILKNAKYNVTAQLKKELRGERGPRGLKGEIGPQGPPGKPGSGNISTCVYKLAQAKFSVSRSAVYNVFATQNRGWFIISATCSTDGAAQSNLRRAKRPDGIQYSCQCKGAAVGHSGPATCFIHYWQCPKI